MIDELETEITLMIPNGTLKFKYSRYNGDPVIERTITTPAGTSTSTVTTDIIRTTADDLLTVAKYFESMDKMALV